MISMTMTPRLTFTCYEPGDNASVMGIDLATGRSPISAKCPELTTKWKGSSRRGIYLRGERPSMLLLGGHGSGNIDIWKLRLDGTGKNFDRLTFFNDFEGGKSSNPVVATNGGFMAFQIARTNEPAGVGHGILIYRFNK